MRQIYDMPQQVIVLHAAMGYGKTALMTDYFKNYQIPCAWYQLGRTDDDINRFFDYFQAMLQGQVSTFCTNKKPADWNQETLELAVNQILEQFEQWNGILNIVFDDFQFIQNPLIFEFISLFIRFMGTKIRLFFLLKGKFPAFISRFVFQGTAAVLETEDLKVTSEELADSNIFNGLSDVEKVMNFTEGWIVAVNYLIMHRKEIGRNTKLADFFYKHSDFSDYLFYETLNSLSVKQQIFMTESALLENIRTDACEYILETDSAEDYLRFFAEKQLLTCCIQNQGYRYHNILRMFLSKKIKEDRKREILRRAVQYYCLSGNKEQVMIYQQMLESEETAGPSLIKISPYKAERIQLSCFGEIRLHNGDGKNIVHWRTRKTKEMFAFLWDQEDRAVSKERVMDALWQDGNGQRIETLFHTTLSYLKRTFSSIGIPDLIQMENKKYTMKRQCFKSDTSRLVQLYELWKNDLQKKDIERRFEELNSIYQGDYMEDLDGCWIISGREHYQGIYLKCCDLLVNQAVCTKKYDLAICVLERALKIDPYSDRLNGMYLKNLCAIGEVQAAKQQYERYKKMLREELNIGIGINVREIYKNKIVGCIG